MRSERASRENETTRSEATIIIKKIKLNLKKRSSLVAQRAVIVLASNSLPTENQENILREFRATLAQRGGGGKNSVDNIYGVGAGAMAAGLVRNPTNNT